MKLALILLAASAFAQALPVLPQVVTVGGVGASCTITVLDSDITVEMVCITSAPVPYTARTAPDPVAKMGAGPVMCLVWRDGSVRLQCATDYGAGPVLAVDGTLAPVPRKRNNGR